MRVTDAVYPKVSSRNTVTTQSRCEPPRKGGYGGKPWFHSVRSLAKVAAEWQPRRSVPRDDNLSILSLCLISLLMTTLDSIRPRHPQHVLADVREHHIRRHGRGPEQPRLAPFALDVVLAGVSKPAERLQASFTRFPRRV